MATEPSTVTDRLIELEARVSEAEARVRALRLEQTEASRARDRAMIPTTDYWREIGRGGARDPEREAKLERDLADETSHLTRRPILTRGDVSGWKVVDERVEAQLAGASESLETASRTRDRYLAEHRVELIAEAMPAALEAARDLLVHHDRAATAGRTFHAAGRRLDRFGFEGELPVDPAVDGRALAALRRFAESGETRG